MNELDDMLDDVANAIQKLTDAGYMFVGEDLNRFTVYNLDNPFEPVAEVFENQTGVTWEWM